MAEGIEVNKLAGLTKNMLDEKYWSVGVAINCSILQRRFPIGSEVGFKVGRKHYKIIRDK